jgi:hypothetical protein
VDRSDYGQGSVLHIDRGAGGSEKEVWRFFCVGRETLKQEASNMLSNTQESFSPAICILL